MKFYTEQMFPLFLLVFISCSSRKKEEKPPERVNMKHAWDYDQVRKARTYEAESSESCEENRMCSKTSK